MKDQILKIKENANNEIKNAEDLQTLNDVRVKYLGKKGELTAVLRGMGALSPEERPVIGGFVNEARDEIERSIEKKEAELKDKSMKEKLEKEKIDITMPSKKTPIGSIHTITGVIDNIKAFIRAIILVNFFASILLVSTCKNLFKITTSVLLYMLLILFLRRTNNNSYNKYTIINVNNEYIKYFIVSPI